MLTLQVCSHYLNITLIFFIQNNWSTYLISESIVWCFSTVCTGTKARGRVTTLNIIVRKLTNSVSTLWLLHSRLDIICVLITDVRLVELRTDQLMVLRWTLEHNELVNLLEYWCYDGFGELVKPKVFYHARLAHEIRMRIANGAGLLSNQLSIRIGLKLYSLHYNAIQFS